MLVISSKPTGSMETSVLLRFHECFQNLLMTREALLVVITVLTPMADGAQVSWRLIAAGSQALGSFWTDRFFCRHFSLSVLAHRLRTCYAQGMWVACPETALCPSSSVSSKAKAWMGASLNSAKFLVSLLDSEVS